MQEHAWTEPTEWAFQHRVRHEPGGPPVAEQCDYGGRYWMEHEDVPEQVLLEFLRLAARVRELEERMLNARVGHNKRVAALEAENAALREERSLARKALLSLAYSGPGGVLRAAIDRALPEAPATEKETGPAPDPDVNCCNRHGDCAAAEAAYRERTGRDPGFSFHCHDDCCEECFGS